MADTYKKMMDDTFKKYYERFRDLNATSKEYAVTIDELFPDDKPLLFHDRMHKMLSMGVVKRVGIDRYWLDEKRAADGKGVLKQRIMILVIAAIIALVLILLDKFGIFSIG
jgi:hypothetical protein